MDDPIEQIRQEIMAHNANKIYTNRGIMPLFLASMHSKVAVIGQAPGIRAQSSGVAWDDASGERLMDWLGVDESTFRDPSIFALIPMDFYYPGKGKSGDLPPRKEFAPLWHKRLLDHMPDIELIILIGQYSQKYYLGKSRQRNLTETVHNYESYLPTYFPLVHPSPLNFRWLPKNLWFEQEIVPVLQKTVAAVVAKRTTNI